MKIAFLDRDGTLIWEPPETKQVDSLGKLRILPGVIEGLRTLLEDGFELVMVSNQDGIGSPTFSKEGFEIPQNEFLSQLEREGITFRSIFVCPHKEAEKCTCRKPKTGLVDVFLQEENIDLASSLMVGDRETDRMFAESIGVRFISMETNGRFPRFSAEKRQTKETDIEAFVNLDGSGKADVYTGIGFFDHMLELLTKHALIDLTLKANGDLNVDEHHTVEDTGLVLGSLFSKALGDKRGIERYGFWVPMDEALAYVVVDLSGRPYFVFEGEWKREYVGELPTELVSHFFESLAQTLKCNLHMKIERGENDHHKIEALFKGLGRALRQAFRQSPYECGIPSTKGSL
ncbi:MAG: imidazoleglycerol-phosphate dehydratase HisB [Candidatus Peribacteraceae bacterium]|nr:imidazoleglycerol-phosphate dehydratase HisB [Candidatus Peribacteraceae bacterium]